MPKVDLSSGDWEEVAQPVNSGRIDLSSGDWEEIAQPPQEAGLGAKLYKRGEKIGAELAKPFQGANFGIPDPIHLGGAVAGGVNDIAAAAASGLYGLLPQKARDYAGGFIEEAFADKTPVGGAIASAVKGAVKIGGKGYGFLKQADPELAEYAEDIANITMAVPVVKGIAGLAGLTKGAIKKTLSEEAIAANLAKQPIQAKEALAKMWDNKIVDTVEDKLRYSLGKRKVTDLKGQIKRKTDDAVAIKTIVENKDIALPKNEIGETILPKTRYDTQVGLHNTKSAVWQEVDDMLKQAGQAGVEISGDDIAKVLDVVAFDSSILRAAPDKAKYAKEIADRYRGQKIPIQVAQKDLAEFNDGLHAFYQSTNIDKPTLTAAYVEAKTADALRNVTDDAFNKMNLPQFRELKNKYSALRSIEQDINIAANKQLADKLGIKLIDYASGYGVLYGIINRNPGAIVGSFFTKGLQIGKDIWTNPDKNIERMFKNVDKLTTRTKALEIPKPGIPVSPKPRQSVKTPMPLEKIPVNAIKTPELPTPNIEQSPASVEAISRVKTEKAKGVKRVAIDTRTGKEKPLIGVDAVDYRVQPFEVSALKKPNGTLEIIDAGKNVNIKTFKEKIQSYKL